MLIERGIRSLLAVPQTSFPLQIPTICAEAAIPSSRFSFLAETGPGGALHCGTPKRGALIAALVPKRRRAQRRLLSAAGLLLVLGSLACLVASAQTARFSYRRTVGSGFNNPWGVAVNGRGDVFVADTGNYAVKQIVAVNGAVSASSTVIPVGNTFGSPWGVAVDGSGDVFVTTVEVSVVEEIVAANGVVSSSSPVIQLGSGFGPFQGVAVDGSGNVFVTNNFTPVVEEIVAVNGTVSGSSAIIPVGSGFSYPDGIAVDNSGNVFVADPYSNTVKEIVAVNGAVSGSSTVIPVGSGFFQPVGVAVDGSGNVFVADGYPNAVKEIVAVNGTVSSSSAVITVAGAFAWPNGIAVDNSGNVFVADSANNALVEISTGAVSMGSVNVGTTSPVFTFTFTFDTGGTIAAPAVLTQGAANKDFTDAGTGTCTTNGTAHTYSTGDTCTVDVNFTPARPGLRLGAVQLASSGGAIIATGKVYGTGIGPMVTFPSSTAVNTVGSAFSLPLGVAVDGSGNAFVSDSGNSAVKEILAAGGYTTVKTVGSGFKHPVGIAVDGSGNVFVADNYSCCGVQEIVAVGGVVSSTSTVKTVGSGFHNPSGVAVDASGNVFVSDTNNELVKEIVAGTGSAASGTVTSDSTVKTLGGSYSIPSGLAVDGSGNIFVADVYNNAVKEILAAGNYTTVKTVGSGFNHPGDVAVDANGNVYVADINNNAVKEILAGTGGAASGTVTSASTVTTLSGSFSLPNGVALDGSGNIFVADQDNNAVKVINLSDPPSLTFAPTAWGSTSSDSPKAVTVANSGNAPLTFPISATGSNPSISPNFTLNSDGDTACPLITSTAGTLAPGASCTLPISFTPATYGTKSGSLMLTDNNLNASSPSYATQSIALSGTGTGAAVTLTSSPNPSSVNQGVTLTATVTGGMGTPTGTVTFKSNGTVLSDCPPVTLDGAGHARCFTATLPAGTDSLTADYSGDVSYLATTSPTITQTEYRSSSTTRLASSGALSTVTQPVTFTATIAPSPAPFTATVLVPFLQTATVAFTDGATTITGCGSAAVTFDAATGTASAQCIVTSFTSSAHSISAIYSGDSNYTSSTSSALTQTVSALATSLGVTASPSSSTSVNAAVTFTAQLAGGPFTVAPAGTVTFTINGNSNPDCPARTVSAGGNATCTTYSLGAGANSVTASYSGDSNYTVAASATVSQAVSTASSVTVVASTPNTEHDWTVDQPVTLKASVTPSSGGAAYVPFSGSVTFADWAGSLDGCSSAVAVNANTGVATCTVTTMTAGFHGIHATYGNDTNYSDSRSSDLGNTVDKAATTTTLAGSSAGNNSTVNDSVTFTATVTPSPVPSVANEAAITGLVAFFSDGSNTPISGCSAQVVSYSASTGKAAATCTTAALTAAGSPHSILARFLSDSNYNSSDSIPLTQTVSALEVTIGLQASPSGSTSLNDSVTFVAQLAGGPFVAGVNLGSVVPSGTVSFTVNGGAISGCSARSVNSSGTATCTTSSLSAGSDAIAAAYSGDANFVVAAPGTATHTVAALVATLGITASPSSSTFVNDVVTFTASLAGVAFAPVAPSGRVTFSANGSAISGCGSVPVDAAGMADCSTSTLAAGADPVSAAYSGDTNFIVTAPANMTQAVLAHTTTASSDASTTFSTGAQTLALTATVTSNSGTVNAGTVTFTVLMGSTVVGTPATSGTVTGGAAGAAYLLPAAQSAGSYTLQAVYNPGGIFAASTDSSHALTISKLTPTITWNTPGPITYGTPLSNAQLNASSTTDGTFAYTPLVGTVLKSGSQPLSVSFTPKDATNYAMVKATVTLLVNHAVLSVSADNIARPYGMANPAFTATLTGFVNNDPQSVISGAPSLTTTAATSSPVGAYPIAAAQGSLAAANYSFTFAPGTLTITKATPAITWAQPAAITYGTALGAAQLNASSPVAGAFSYSPASGKVLSAGSQKLSVTFTPTDTTNCTTTTASLTLQVNQAKPSITWGPPAAISYGTALSATQLKATSATPGTFVYKPALGTVPASGSQTLSATLTPTDSTDYASATATVTLVVNPVALTIRANNASRTYGATNPAFAAAFTGFVNGDSTATALTGSPSLTTTATAKSSAGTYPITAAVGSLAAANYTFKFAPATLTVTKAPLIIAATSVSVPYNQAIPKLTYTGAGFMNNDTLSVLTGTPTETTTAKQGSAVSTYPITIVQGTLAASNYSFAFQNGTLTVAALGTTATPAFKPAGGSYTSIQSVTLADSTAGATIYYTLNGATPSTSSTKYVAAIPVAASETINAIAVAPGYTQSAPASAAYMINLPLAATPTFSIAAGTYNNAQTVTIASTTAGATIYYTTNGATPTTASTKYTAAVKVASSETINAIAVATGYQNSAVASSPYTLLAAAPVFKPAAGTYTSVQSVTLASATTGATVYYTTNGSTPTTSSAKYTAAISVGTTETLNAIAVATGFLNSAVTTAAYTINLPTLPAPTFSVAAGTYNASQTVTITDSIKAATIYYTTNGSAPTTSSTKYTAAIKVSASETLTAVAVAAGYNNSPSASAAYTIATAPAVVSQAATALSTSGATLNATVIANNATTQYWFAYGTSKTTLTSSTSKAGALTGASATSVNSVVTGLKAKTVYFFQAVASNAAGTTRGAVLSFTTD